MNRKTSRSLKKELNEIDYLDKLSPEDKAYVIQFYREFHQADFNFPNPIHPRHLRKDCYNRNNASKRQVDSVKESEALRAARAARDNQGVKGQGNKYYTPEDYLLIDDED